MFGQERMDDRWRARVPNWCLFYTLHGPLERCDAVVEPVTGVRTEGGRSRVRHALAARSLSLSVRQCPHAGRLGRLVTDGGAGGGHRADRDRSTGCVLELP